MSPEEIAAKLDPLQREWLTGWQGVEGAAYNAVATSLRHLGMLKGPLDWSLNATGIAVREILMKEQNDGQL